LARLELSEVISATAKRLNGWKFDIDPAGLMWFPLTEPFRGLARLPVSAP